MSAAVISTGAMRQALNISRSALVSRIRSPTSLKLGLRYQSGSCIKLSISAAATGSGIQGARILDLIFHFLRRRLGRERNGHQYQFEIFAARVIIGQRRSVAMVIDAAKISHEQAPDGFAFAHGPPPQWTAAQWACAARRNIGDQVFCSAATANSFLKVEPSTAASALLAFQGRGQEQPPNRMRTMRAPSRTQGPFTLSAKLIDCIGAGDGI